MTAPLVRPRLLPFLFLLVYFSNLCKIIASETREREIRFPKPQFPYLSDAVVSRIAFGSCANQSAPQPIWNAIIDFAPQLFIWLGDNIYGDNRRPLRFFGREATFGPLKNTPRFFPSEESEMRRRYQLAKAQPGYSQLRKRAQVIGTWDDHDYGLNDAGKEFSEKNTSQRLLLDFLDEPEDSARRRQAGVYASYLFGPKGKQVKVSDQLCFELILSWSLVVLPQVILLDTRYHRDPLFSDGTILGESQWEWLEKELYGPGSEITIIASSIQIVSNLSASTGPIFYVESWGHFPKERERLYKLISDSERSGVFFISGDVHFAEITRYDCGCEYPLYDITSSGLTQAVERTVPPPLDYLLSLLCGFNYIGLDHRISWKDVCGLFKGCWKQAGAIQVLLECKDMDNLVSGFGEEIYEEIYDVIDEEIHEEIFEEFDEEINEEIQWVCYQ
ncbi:alkaline phosphatase D [Dendrobium catenatum]|uniref:Alkaline phosphatase D n=1 Tax=Dendrobium catenatum TaxID=906689 RepID=A0A2I0X1I2_9ASPA|nr:alkaline phosphatase D [Dendrobium catenatum]